MESSVKNAQVKTVEKKQYVTFSIGKEMYGIDVVRTQEVLNLIKITQVPNTMPFMKGVIDLRGRIVPLVDVRIKFRLPEREYDQNTVIIIVQVRDVTVGLIVDSVSDVIGMAVEDIQNTPHFTLEIDRDAVVGIGHHNDQLVIVLDVDKILSLGEVESIRTK